MAQYDRALPQVYGYLADRCRDPATAEDLTSETFLAAVRAAKAPARPVAPSPPVPRSPRPCGADSWRSST